MATRIPALVKVPRIWRGRWIDHWLAFQNGYTDKPRYWWWPW